MKKTVLRPKKEKQQGQINVININIQNKSTKEGYLDSDLEEPDNKKIYNNVITRIENKQLESFKNIELKPQNKNKYVFKTERSNRYKDMNKEEKGEKKLRRKTVDRGGKYNNIQTRYIIYSKKDIKFHIVEPTMVSLDKPLVYDKNRKYRKEPKGKVKIEYRSSCDNIAIRHKDKKTNPGKTVYIYHCAELNQKNVGKYENKTARYINNMNIISIPRANKNIPNEKLKSNYQRISDNRNKIQNVYKIKEGKNDDKSKKIFLLKNYYRIFKNKINNLETEYERWFKRHCENNKNKKTENPNEKLNNFINYLYPKTDFETDINKKMPYDEWFNRNCEKSENTIKKYEEEKAKKELMDTLRKIILNKDDESEKIKKIENVIDKYDNNKKKDILNSLKLSLNDQFKKNQINDLIEKYNNIEEEECKKELIKSSKDDLIKNKIENLINLWEGENKILSSQDDKNKKFDEMSNLFKNGEKNKLIDELSKLNKKDKLEIIDNLKNQNKSKENEINELNNLSDMKEKLENLIKVLTGTTENIKENPDKMKNILDILLSLDKDSRKNCINYMRKKANDDFKKNIELLSLINSLPEEIEEKDKFQKDNFNYSYSYSTSVDKINNSEINNEEKKEKEIEDDIFDIVNDIDNEEEKKQLAEDEFKEISNNVIYNLYENDDDINDEELNKIVESLNDLENNDKMKAMEKLKQKADNEKKKKIFSKLANKMNVIRNSIKILKNAMNQKKKEPDEIVLDDLKTESSKSFIENRENEDINTNNNINNNNFNNTTNKLSKTMNKFKSFGQANLLKNNLSNIDYLNKLKNISDSVLFLHKTINFNFDEDTNNNKTDLDKEELKKLINNIEKDLFEEREKPLARKEERKNEKENNKKLKEISKVIYSLSKNDKNKLFYKLGLRANNEYKTSQLTKLYNLVKNISSIKQYAENNLKKNGEELSEFDYQGFLIKINNELFNNKEENKEEIMKDICDKISNLNEIQQNRIMNDLKFKNNDNSLFRILKKRIKESNESKSFFKTLINNKAKIFKEENKGKENLIKELDIELSDDDLIKIVNAILYQISIISKINPKKIYINEVENYLLKKEEENKLEEIINIMNMLKKEDKEEIIGILTFILENNNEFIKKLNEEMGIKMESIEKLLEEYKKENKIKELGDTKLEELAEEILVDLMKESPDNEKRIESINKAANIIINLNKNDQEKVLYTLNSIKKNEYQKENIDKLNNLIENLNNMRLYLFTINQNNFNKDLSDNELNNLKDEVKTQIFNEMDLNDNNRNIDKIAFRLSTLSNKDQNNILKEINERVGEFHDNSRKSVDQLNKLLKSIKLAQKFTSAFKSKKKISEKKKLSDDKMKELSFNISNQLTNYKNPTNWTEKLLIDKNEERKIQNLAGSINVLDEECQRKTISFLSKKTVNEKQKNDINKLKNSLIINNDKNKNMFTSQYYMIKSLGITDLNDVELNALMQAFSKDLFNDQIIDNNKREENLNLIANLIKELDEENQIKIIEKLENEPEAQNNINLMKDLKDRILKLNLLKDELREEKEEKIENEIKYEEEDLIEDLDEDENDKTVTVEITADEIDENDINEICQVFKVNYEDVDQEKKNKFKENKSLNLLASSLIKLGEKSQKKISDKLEEKLNNNDEKNQLEELLQNLKKLNICKNLGKEIKEKIEKAQKIFEEEIINTLKLNDNGKKNLDEENLNKLKEKIINGLFSDIKVDFNKNENIKKFLTETKKEEIILKNAERIVILTNNDQEIILNEIKIITQEENDKLNIYNKLCKYINILTKLKTMTNNFELKKNDLIESDLLNLNSDNPKERLETLIQNLNNEDVQKKDIINVVNEIMKLDDINQEIFLNNLKEKINTNDKDFIMKQIEQMLNKKKEQNKFAYNVLEGYIKKMILEKEKTEKKFGIFIDDKDKRATILLKKPNELKIDNFNEMKNNFIEDFKRMNEETDEKDNDISYLQLYTKKKEKEKKLEEIADVINSLDNDDKIKILDEFKNIFEEPKYHDLYNEFIEILKKRERKFNEEKREKKKETYKEIEEKKESDENNLLYSFVDVKTDKNNNSSDIVNFSEDAVESTNNKYENKLFTFHKGILETQEIY